LFWIVLPVLLISMVFSARQGFARWMASYHLQQVESLVDRLEREGHLRRRESQRGIQLAFGEAIKLLRRAQELDPSKVEVLIVRGSLHRLLRRPKAALEAYKQALALEPRPEVFTQMGHVYRSLGRKEQARAAYRSAILLDHTLARDLRGYLGGKNRPPKKINSASESKATTQSGEHSDG
jgi:tetratricopeptide (TPR) repeat protein